MKKFYYDALMMPPEPNIPNAYTDAFYLASDVDARIAELEKYRRAVEDHNKSCVDRCAGASTCGYKQYFLANGRRCPNCPVHESIEL